MTTEDLLKRIEALESALYGPFDDRLRVQERLFNGIMAAGHSAGSPSWPRAPWCIAEQPLTSILPQ